MKSRTRKTTIHVTAPRHALGHSDGAVSKILEVWTAKEWAALPEVDRPGPEGLFVFSDGSRGRLRTIFSTADRRIHARLAAEPAYGPEWLASRVGSVPAYEDAVTIRTR